MSGVAVLQYLPPVQVPASYVPLMLNQYPSTWWEAMVEIKDFCSSLFTYGASVKARDEAQDVMKSLLHYNIRNKSWASQMPAAFEKEATRTNVVVETFVQRMWSTVHTSYLMFCTVLYREMTRPKIAPKVDNAREIEDFTAIIAHREILCRARRAEIAGHSEDLPLNDMGRSIWDALVLIIRNHAQTYNAAMDTIRNAPFARTLRGYLMDAGCEISISKMTTDWLALELEWHHKSGSQLEFAENTTIGLPRFYCQPVKALIRAAVRDLVKPNPAQDKGVLGSPLTNATGQQHRH